MPDEIQPTLGGGDIEPIEIQEEMERSFLDYAMSVITARALPDARDGLKPVQRRIMYGMYEQGLRPDRKHRKSAQAVGEVMGKYHPHDSTAIYDALARMAQDFSLRYPLVDGHGNFGSPDPNDRPAAQRYCVVGETRVRTSEGTRRIDSLAPVVPNSEVDLDLKVLDRDGGPVLASRLFHSGDHPTFRLETREGFELIGTGNHPVLCLDRVAGVPMLQWKVLGEIQPDERVVISRQVDGIGAFEELTDDEDALAVLTGAWLAEGWASDRRAGFNNCDRAFFDVVLAAYDRVVGGRRYVYDRIIKSGRRLFELDVQDLSAFSTSPLVEFIGTRSAEKSIPDYVWRSSMSFKQRVLQAMFEGDGSVMGKARNSIELTYSTYSPQLARDVQELLLEFGVISRRVTFAKGEFKVMMSNRREARLFERNVGFHGAKQAQLSSALDAIPVRSRAMWHDHVPFLAEYVRGEEGSPWLDKYNINRTERWERFPHEILDHIESEEVRSVIAPLVSSAYYYARVTAVTPAGVRPVYSVKVESDDHSFLAGGFVNHNTEARLAAMAMDLIGEIDEETVDWSDTYDGENTEPVVLPARYPNLLANGCGGIAVGMATNIPPHNLTEIIAAAIHVIDNPDATPDQLMEFVHGPDFPTGAMILGRDGIFDAYRTGRGSIRLRAKNEIEEGRRGEMRIVVSEIPYQTSAEVIGQKIAELVNDRKVEGIRDVRNESAGDSTRLVIELKRDANPQVVLNQLYKHTPMQTSFPVHMLALVDGVPRLLNLAQMVRVYVDHQVEVVTRRTQFRLKKDQERAHIVEGLVRALDMIDAIIALIRGAADVETARAGLMAKPFEFSEIQANFILDMQLRRLTQLEGKKLRDELEELQQRIAELESILKSKTKLKGIIKKELGELSSKYGDERRTPITLDVSGDLDILDLIEDEEMIVVLSQKGYIKSVAADAFRRQGRGGKGVRGGNLRDGDYVAHLLPTTAHSYLLFFSNRGRVYRLRAHEIPMKERTARGVALVNLLSLTQDEQIQAIIDTRTYEDGAYLLFATKNGIVKKTRMSEYDSSIRSGLKAINLRGNDELVKVIQTTGNDDIVMVSRQGMTIRFAESGVRAMGRDAGGVRGMKLRSEDDAVVAADVARPGAVMLFVSTSGHGKRTKLDLFKTQGRGGQGVRGIKITASRGAVVGAFGVSFDDEILVFSSGGNIIRMGAKEISSQGRDATGVRVARLGEGETVVAVAPVLEAGDGEDV